MYKNKYLLKFVILYMVVIFTFTGCSYKNSNNIAPRAMEGILDLTDWKLEEDLISLDGQWEFYWNQLLTPQDFKHSNTKEMALIDFPRAWNSYEVDDKILTGDGYATYRLIVTSANDNRLLGLRIPRILTSYKMWVNDEPLAFAGTVGKNIDEMIPQYHTQVVFFESQQNEIEIVIQVSNFKHRSGGILESLRLGDANKILHLRYRNIALALFLFGSLLIMGLYHLFLFAFRRKEFSFLYFGIFCIFVAMRTLLVGEMFFIDLFPNFNWEIAHKLQTLSFYIGVPIFLTFFRSIFPEKLSNKVVRVSQRIGLAFGLLVLFTPARIFTRFNPLFQVFALALIVYILYSLVKILYNKEIGARLIGVGALALIITSINDIIFLSTWMSDNNYQIARSIIRSGNLSSFGQLIFVFTHSLVLAKKFSDALIVEESMANYQKELNENLERLVKKRTKALQLSKEKIQQQKSELQEANKALQLLSSKDPLTNMWNRRHFDESLHLEWRRGLRLRKAISLIYIDIDYFKDFNDHYGHQAGDTCLKQVAQVLNDSLNRAGDLVARYGGEEFVVLMPNIERDKALDMAEAIRVYIEELKIPHHHSPISNYVTVSLGVTTMVPNINTSSKDLILAADKALYSAKAKGRNQVKFSNSSFM